MPENFEMQADFSIFVRMDNGEIIIYRTADGETRLEVRMESDSVWLTQAQIAELFQTTPQNITMHTNHVFREGELEKEATCKRSLQVRQEGTRTIRRIQNIYNLDVIISVGYRVKSPRGTQFRIWANKVLKEYLIKGYAVNNQAKAEQLEELKKTVRLLSHVLAAKEVTKSEAVGLLRVITDYTYASIRSTATIISSWRCRPLRLRSRSARPMRMRWRHCRCCATSSAAAHCSPARRTSRSRAP